MRRKKFIDCLRRRKKYSSGGVVKGSGSHVEEDTECDKCEHKEECIERGGIVDITTNASTRKHYIKGVSVVCKKDSFYQVVKVGVAYNELKRYMQNENTDTNEAVRLMQELVNALNNAKIFEAFHKGML